MEILSIGFPYSIVGIGAGLLVGGWIMVFLFGIFTTLIVFLALWYEIIRIDPILEGIQKILRYFFPSYIEQYKENIKKSFKLELDETICTNTESKQRIYIWHPHGLFSVSVFFHLLSPFTEFPERLRPMYTVVLSTLAKIPGLGQLYRILNLIPSNKCDISKGLSEKKSLSIVLGGVREMLYVKKNKLILNIKEKKGIFRLALEYGIPLVPVISYGENELYEQVDIPLLHKFNTYFVEYCKLFLPVPTWKCIENWKHVLEKPLSTPIRTVVGPEIIVKKHNAKDINQRMVEDLRETYFTAVRSLYKSTRPQDYADEIEIV